MLKGFRECPWLCFGCSVEVCYPLPQVIISLIQVTDHMVVANQHRSRTPEAKSLGKKWPPEDSRSKKRTIQLIEMVDRFLLKKI